MAKAKAEAKTEIGAGAPEENGKPVKQEKTRPINGLKYGVGHSALSVPGKAVGRCVVKASWGKYSFFQEASAAPEERIGWYVVRYVDEFLRVQEIALHESELSEVVV